MAGIPAVAPGTTIGFGLRLLEKHSGFENRKVYQTEAIPTSSDPGYNGRNMRSSGYFTADASLMLLLPGGNRQQQ